MNIASNTRLTLPSINLAGSPDSRSHIPVDAQSSRSCPKLPTAPLRSSNTFQMFHPFVDFLLQFSQTCGMYLITVITTLALDSTYITSNHSMPTEDSSTAQRVASTATDRQKRDNTVYNAL